VQGKSPLPDGIHDLPLIHHGFFREMSLHGFLFFNYVVLFFT
jgi:hypothetical protein